MTILVAKIVINDNILSPRWNPATPSLSSNQKRLENNKNNFFFYQNGMFENYKDR
jgi:hypothetical protein